MENNNSGKLSGRCGLQFIVKKLCSLFLTAVFVFACLSLPAQAAKSRLIEEHRAVRVGYYPVTEYQDKDADGKYFGFSYDYYMNEHLSKTVDRKQICQVIEHYCISEE